MAQRPTSSTTASSFTIAADKQRRVNHGTRRRRGHLQPGVLCVLGCPVVQRLAADAFPATPHYSITAKPGQVQHQVLKPMHGSWRRE